MEVDDLINCMAMHCSSPGDEVIIMINGKEYVLTGTIVGDENESALFIYAEEG